MPVDNDLYNRLADTWWDERGILSHLGTVFNPSRFGYFRRVLTQTLSLDPPGKQALDVGCGGGLLAEEFARLGFQVTGIDPSGPSIEAARVHAATSGLNIGYSVGTAERLPFADLTFDLVYCCDVLEHVEDLDRVLAESARVLKPGGVYCYDTINRTLRSKFFIVRLAQDWNWSNFLPPRLHAWEKFIKPDELRRLLERCGLEPRETVGLQSRANPLRLLFLLRRYKRGKISLAELGAAAHFRAVRNLSLQYMGYAVKPATSVRSHLSQPIDSHL